MGQHARECVGHEHSFPRPCRGFLLNYFSSPPMTSSWATFPSPLPRLFCGCAAFFIASMSEVALTGRHEGDVVAVGEVDGFLVFFGAAGVDDGGDAGVDEEVGGV